MATNKQNELFVSSCWPDPLGDAVGWIGMNYNPEDVFSEKQLESWAALNGFKKGRTPTPEPGLCSECRERLKAVWILAEECI